MRKVLEIASLGFVFSVMVPVIAASLVSAGAAAEVSRSAVVPADDDGAAAKRLSYQGIPCNWKGWKNSYPEAECTMKPCDRYVEVLQMKCSDGFITEARVDSICFACQPPLSP